MRGSNFLAGVGTISIFLGIYCFKAVFYKKTSEEKLENFHYTPVKHHGKGFLILLGSVCFILGLLLLFKSLKFI